ncbi:tRNA (adenosine(37)-N6)-threonylcarbamoyltransferase complex transferase subunit TsaD [Sulfurihydrogenibium yellowstonense]|uniref:tRNA N6-adenosine threonylcarbamoyltransferase n=1 Tax=Sulfurihydrogenibium yellowstonense SS-5 TaxID=432331 RepID=C4FIW7_9AQUI|nr:tRNA (adenosine(37)-N6)-threonylcarbamoyltransferase complex transferase subunit TsaD [Sulfurihydrogenibium yellowstonense]EEP60973.1 O-sialoglycoprotein endopeptidase [Sulfurihydrogenibium yellowstonense SS-5]
MIVLGIETSCDDTSVAVYDSEKGILSNVVSSQLIHAQFGGVYPEIAAREHTKNFLPVLDKALKDANIVLSDIDAIATTFMPGLIVSLVAGVSGAKALSFSVKKPLIPVHHIEAHIFANFIKKEIEYPFLALVVSGGHTELILVKEFEDYIYLGGTLDDAVGEVYDKVARALGLGFPGGPIIDKLAKEGKEVIKFPRPLLNDEENKYNFSFSGLKSAVIREINKGIYKQEDIAKSFQNAVVDVLVKKTVLACKEFGINRVVVAGGVSANSQLREEFLNFKDLEVHFPPMYLCTDNGAMVAYTGYKRFKEKGVAVSLDFEAKARCRIDKFPQLLRSFHA